MQFGGIQIYDQFEPGRLYDRQVRRFGTIENATDIDTHLEPVGTNSRVANQATGRDELGPFVHHRHLIAGFGCYQLIAAYLEKQIGAHKERTGRSLNQALKGEIDFSFGAGVYNKHALADGAGGLLNLRNLHFETKRLAPTRVDRARRSNESLAAAPLP